MEKSCDFPLNNTFLLLTGFGDFPQDSEKFLQGFGDFSTGFMAAWPSLPIVQLYEGKEFILEKSYSYMCQ